MFKEIEKKLRKPFIIDLLQMPIEKINVYIDILMKKQLEKTPSFPVGKHILHICQSHTWMVAYTEINFIFNGCASCWIQNIHMGY